MDKEARAPFVNESNAGKAARGGGSGGGGGGGAGRAEARPGSGQIGLSE